MGTAGHIQLRAGPAGSPGITPGEADGPSAAAAAVPQLPAPSKPAVSRCGVTALSDTTIFPFSSIRLCVMEAAHTAVLGAAHMQDAKIRVAPTVCCAPGQSPGGARSVEKELP